MEDKRLEKRKEFFNPIKDGRIEREKYMVDLRKKKKQELFKSKRSIRMHEEGKEETDSTMGNGTSIAANPNDFPTKKYHDILKEYVPILFVVQTNLVWTFLDALCLLRFW